MSGLIRVVRVTVDGEIEVRQVENDAGSLHDLIGGYMEVIYCKGLTSDPMNSVIGLVDEDGWRQPRPVNPWSYIFYRSLIAGPIVLVRAAPDGDFVSLTDRDISDIQATVGPFSLTTIEP